MKYEDFANYLDFKFAEIQKYLRDLKLRGGKVSNDLRSDCITKCIILNHEIEQKLGDCLK